ncbi:MarR family transcriptional regulator [Streptomyces sp. ERV7]|uniref:MarR family winged helix-turn-helix transcriptional regulator n=1 Tax=Streptomyces sp. ERV7 TaxID=1322334 RepID=UPI000AB6A587|nr:MarR family transcriptional regulator [Streptomyces sp. ERV7]
MAETTEPGGPTGSTGPEEPTLDEQIAAYQREFRDLDPQVEKVVSALGRLNRRMNVAYGRQVAALGISNAEWEVLKTLVLAGKPYRLGPGELAKRLGLTPAAMTHRIDRMAGEGLVTRDRDESNRVRVIVELTDEGRTTSPSTAYAPTAPTAPTALRTAVTPTTPATRTRLLMWPKLGAEPSVPDRPSCHPSLG